MIPKPRPKDQKYLHISIYPLHRELIYLVPTIQLDLKPLNDDIVHIRIYLFTWVVQIEFIGKKKKTLWKA
ncbi:MAG: hypothetical protein PHG08_00600 [Bacilli bacterium]|nr:hypothetical protein [Bacilli bacterium]